MTVACSRQAPLNKVRVDNIRLPGNFADCILADFDNDGLSEIFAMSIDTLAADDEGRVYSRKGSIAHYSNGGFSPSITFDLPPEAIVFDDGDINSDGKPEILYLAGDGLYAMNYSGSGVSEARKIISQNTMFIVPTTRSASYWDMYRVGSGSKRRFLLMPCCNGITVYGIDNGRIDSLGTITIQHRAAANPGFVSETRELNPLTYSCSLPTMKIADYDGDALDDIFVISANKIAIYQGTMIGGFTENPTYIFKPSGAIPDQTLNSGVQFQIDDINNDGRSDIIVTQTQGGVTRFQSDIGIYYGRTRGGYNDKPSYTRHVKQSAGSAYLYDFNADGRTDLAIPELELGITALMKMMILNRLDMQIEVYLQQGGGQFLNEPSLRKEITATVDINSGNISYDNNMSFGGDFNGDHLTDFLMDAGKGNLRIYYGVAGTVLASEYAWSTQIQPATSIMTSDINGDGKDEILAFYGLGSADRQLIRVVWVDSPKK